MKEIHCLMKENGMKENAQTEEQLLEEEQLQAVTGGCGDCVGDRLNAARHLNSAAQHEALSLQPGLLPEQRQAFINQATDAHREAQILLDRVAARHPERHRDPMDSHVPESFVHPLSPR
jgi:NAD(P)H-hydrate repair Nnr-like enzyme with NAD(P)H-hydrate epimerase domain